MSRTWWNPLHDYERDLRPRVRTVSLVAELDIPLADAEGIVQGLGEECLRTHETRWRDVLEVRFPACLVAALPTVGAWHYQAGAYWPALFDLAALPPTPLNQRRWGEALLHGLRGFRLPEFPEAPLTYVGPILLHAGIPDECLGGLLTLLDQRMGADPGQTAEEFLAWAFAPGREARLAGVARPVQNFLREGGEYAEDILDRLLDLTERLGAGSTSLDGLQLPPRLLDGARKWWSERLSDRGGRDGRPHPTRVERPEILLDPYGVGVALSLPGLSDAGAGETITWRVTADGRSATVSNRSTQAGLGEIPRTVVPLNAPCRSVAVALAGRDYAVEVDVVDPADPLLVFDEAGQRIPAVAALPVAPVWLLHPRTSDVVANGELAELAEAEPPYGWEGWRVRLVSADGVRSLRLPEGKPRNVAGVRRARIVTGEPVELARTTTDGAVFSELPVVELPGEPGVTLTWSVSIRLAGTGNLLLTRQYEVRDRGVVQPFADLPRPVAGAFEAVVRGPLGRGLTRAMTIVEGLRVLSEPRFRQLTPSGLVPATVDVRAAGLVEPPSAALRADQHALPVTATGPGGTAHLRIQPGFMGVQRLHSTTGSVWSTRPLTLLAEDLVDTPGALLVRLPVGIGEVTLSVAQGPQVVQEIGTTGRASGGVARFELSKIVETVADGRRWFLSVNYLKLTTLVASVRPRHLTAGVRLDGESGRLVLDECVDADGLAVGVYRVCEPWQEPEVLPATDGLTPTLSQASLAAGPLRALARIEDPWLPVEWPDWPNRSLPGGDLFYLPGERQRSSGGSAFGDLLAGMAHGDVDAHELPAGFDELPAVYVVYGLARQLAELGSAEVIRDLCAALLARHPARSLGSLRHVHRPRDVLVPPLVAAGLLATPLGVDVPADLASGLWISCPAAALVASSGALRAVVTGGSDETSDALAEEAAVRCGPAWRALLEGRNDPCPHAGSFDPTTELIANWPDEQVEELWAAARVVPKAHLDEDSRTAAAFQLFAGRRYPRWSRLHVTCRDQLPALKDRLANVAPGRVIEAVEHRTYKPGWLSLPAWSLGLAVAARLAARAVTPFDEVYREPHLLEAHAQLARRAPELVTTDVLLAEALLLRERM